MIHLPRGSQILSRRPQVYKDPRKWQQNASLVVVILAAKKGGGEWQEASIISILHQQTTSRDMQIGNSHRKKISQ